VLSKKRTVKALQQLERFLPEQAARTTYRNFVIFHGRGGLFEAQERESMIVNGAIIPYLSFGDPIGKTFVNQESTDLCREHTAVDF
jgi:hypothetical protein